MTRYRIAIVLTAFAALTALGCESSQPQPRGPVAPAVDDEDTSIAQANGVYLVLDLPKTQFAPGETFTAAVTAVNQSAQPLNIQATSSALCNIHLWKPQREQWERIKTYPQAAAAVMSPWTLRPGEERTFKFDLTVESDWPTYELLRLQAELNGVPNLAPHVDIEILRED